MKLKLIAGSIFIAGFIAQSGTVNGYKETQPGDKYPCAYLGGVYRMEMSLPMWAKYTECHKGETRTVKLEDINQLDAAVGTIVSIHTISEQNAIGESERVILETDNKFQCYGLMGASSCNRY